MSQPTVPQPITAQIQGEITGQVTVGNYNVQIGSVHGGVVTIAPPGPQPGARPRQSPVFMRPRASPGFLDREAEVVAAIASLQSGHPTEFSGQEGTGKSTLLRHLAYHARVASSSDGVILLRVWKTPAADVLLELYDAFYERDASFKPTPVQVRQALQAKQARILLDDVDLSRDEVQEVIETAPGCAFILTSLERRLWGEVHAVALRGLPVDAALELLERELERPLAPDERPAAESLCATLDGHPLRILQAAALVKEHGSRLPDVARSAGATPPLPVSALLASLPEAERRVLSALAALGGAATTAEHLAAITQQPDIEAVLERLLRRRLVHTQSPRYALIGALVQDLRHQWDLEPWIERALSHFSAWAHEHLDAPHRVAEEAEAILAVLEQAGAAGRHKDALRLARALDGPMALAGRWGTWARILEWALGWAGVLGDRAAEGWARHQLGTRALCLQDASSARSHLTQGLRIREALGDQIGAAISRHNLDVLLGPPPPPRGPSEPPAPPRRPVGISAFKGVLAIASAVVLAAGGVRAWQAVTRKPAVALDLREITFESQGVATQSGPRTITLTNSGSRPLAVDRLVLDGDHPGDFGLAADRCGGARVPPGDVCTFSVRFTPASAGRRSAVLRIFNDAPDSPQAVTLNGVGITIEGRLSITPSALRFGEQTIRAPGAPRRITVRNQGPGPVRINAVEPGGPARADFAIEDGCSGVDLPPGQECGLTVVFTAQADGPRSAVLSIAAGARRHSVELTGSGRTPVGVLDVTPQALRFSQQNVRDPSGPQSVVLANRGPGPVGIGRITRIGPHAGDFAVEERCSGATLAPGNSCAVEIVFTPTAAGSRTAALRIPAGSATRTVRLSGTGRIPEGLLVLRPSALEFGEQPVGRPAEPRTIVLVNRGPDPVAVEGISPGGANPGDFAVEERCQGTTLAPGGDCVVTVAFTPGAEGRRSAVLTVAGGGRAQTVEIAGTGVALPGVLAVRPERVDFGDVPVGNPGRPARMIVSNRGQGPLAIHPIAYGGRDAGDFSVDDRCAGRTLSPGEECFLTIDFVPRAEGIRRAAVTIRAGTSSHTVEIVGTGRILAGRLGLKSNRLDFGAIPVGRRSRPLQVTVANLGPGLLTLGPIARRGPHVGDFVVEDPCGRMTLAAGQECFLTVMFAPRAEGTRTAALLITAGARTWTVELTGAGTVLPGELVVGPLDLDFGRALVGTPTTSREVVLRNRGRGPVTVTDVRLSGRAPADFGVDLRCRGSTLGPGQECAMAVRFAPQSDGRRDALLVIEGAGAVREVRLTGFGVPRVRITRTPRAPEVAVPRFLKPGTPDPASPQNLGPCSPVVLTWESVPGAAEYVVTLQRVDPATRRWLTHLQRAVDGTGFTLGRLPEGQTFRWYVWARTAEGRQSRPSKPHYFFCPIR